VSRASVTVAMSVSRHTQRYLYEWFLRYARGSTQPHAEEFAPFAEMDHRLGIRRLAGRLASEPADTAHKALVETDAPR